MGTAAFCSPQIGTCGLTSSIALLGAKEKHMVANTGRPSPCQGFGGKHSMVGRRGSTSPLGWMRAPPSSHHSGPCADVGQSEGGPSGWASREKHLNR